MKSRYSTKDKNRHFSVRDYHNILCPPSEKPDFLQKYLELSVLKRLEGISLLCGTDWTKLYNNRMRYSRLDHSIGVALIVWHFTKDKARQLQDFCMILRLLFLVMSVIFVMVML